MPRFFSSCGFIFPNPYPIIWLLCSFCLYCINSAFFIQYKDLLNPLHVSFCWDIGRTTCYQYLPLVTCRINSWRQFPSTRACSPLLLKRRRLTLAADSWCHIPVTLSLPLFNLFQNSTVDECNSGWTQWNKGWSILFWYSCCRSYCNILDSGFCDLRVMLQW